MPKILVAACARGGAVVPRTGKNDRRARLCSGGGANEPESRWLCTWETADGRSIKIETARRDDGMYVVRSVRVEVRMGDEVVIDEMPYLGPAHVDEAEAVAHRDHRRQRVCAESLLATAQLQWLLAVRGLGTMEEATKLLNASRAKLAELDEHVRECENYVRRMLEISTSKKPVAEGQDRVARLAWVALSDLTNMRDQWHTVCATLEQLADAAERLRKA